VLLTGADIINFSFPFLLSHSTESQTEFRHQGYPAAEMKHGPIALIDHLMPVSAARFIRFECGAEKLLTCWLKVIFVAMKDSIYDKVLIFTDVECQCSVICYIVPSV